MRSLTFVAFGLVWWPIALTAQTIDNHGAQDSGRLDQPSKTGVIGATGPVNAPSYQPLSRSERWGRYIVRTFGPGAVLRAAAGSGINQWLDTPREWKQGGGAFGDRFGSSFTGYVIRQTLESGAAAALHEDDRYFPSTDTGFWKRTKHAVVSVFIARNQAGNLRFSYSRLGATLGTSFISRAWQPPSETHAGDAVASFGVAMAVGMGWNVFKEFRPRRLGRHF